MTDVVTCSVCGAEVGRGPRGLGQVAHAKTHRREFRDEYGRWPVSYEEVRQTVGQQHAAGLDDAQMTLWESLTDEEQRTLSQAPR